MYYTGMENTLKETPGRNLSSTNWGVRIAELGYTLYGGSIDSFGRSWKYRTFPIGSGSIGQFGSLGDLTAWVRRVENIRALPNLTNEYVAALTLAAMGRA